MNNLVQGSTVWFLFECVSFIVVSAAPFPFNSAAPFPFKWFCFLHLITIYLELTWHDTETKIMSLLLNAI